MMLIAFNKNNTPGINNLIKSIFGVLFLLLFGLNSFGQVRHPGQRLNRPSPGRRLELVKEGYISVRLKLTPQEAKSFWPLYRQYVQEQTAIRIAKRLNNSNTSIDGMLQIEKELAYEQQLVEVRKHYRDEFLKILPPEKVSELYKSEREFNDEMVKQLSERSVRAGN